MGSLFQGRIFVTEESMAERKQAVFLAVELQKRLAI
jgi:hypothetical protein